MISATLNTRSRTLRAMTAVTGSLSILAFAATAAYADKRSPAPIVYAGKSAGPAPAAHNTRPSATSERKLKTVPAPLNAAPPRTEFRYPDQPDIAISAPHTAASNTAAAPRAQTVSERSTVAQSPSSAVFQPVSGAVYDETGSASVFDPVLNGELTANGEVLDTGAMVAAHPSLPLPSLVQVINLKNDREIVVRVNDRGPFDNNGLIEVSERAAELLGFADTGFGKVRVRYLGPAPELAGGQSAPVPQSSPAPTPVQVASLETTPAPAAPAPTARPLPAPTDQLFAPAPRQIADVEPPQPTPTLPVADPVSGDRYLIQLASFTDITNAERLHASLNRTLDVNIVPARVRGADYFRVVAGPVSGRFEAESLRDRLAKQGIAQGLVITAP